MNLHMAQESLKEYEDEVDELKAERDAIKADLDRQGTSLQDSQRMLNDATAQIRDHSVRIVDFRTNTQAAETESMSRVRNLVLMIAFHRKALTYRTAGWRNATRALQEATTTISNLRSDISTLEVVRSEVNNLSLRVEEVETARSAVQTDLQRSREDLKKALSEAQTLRTALDETRVSLSSAQQAGVEHSSALARVAELEREISASGERTRGLESDIENLLAKLASAEKARSEAVGTAEAETISLITRLSELESTEGRAASLQSELDTLLADLAARDQTHAEAMTGAKLQMAELFESRKMYERRTAGLRDQLAIKTAEVEAYNAQIHQKTIEVAGLESQLAESSRDIEVGRKTISDHREQLEQLEASSSGTLAEREALRERIVDLQTKVSVLLAERTVLRRDFAETADQHLEIVTGLSTASMEVETLRTANLEHQSSLRGLQANVEKLEEEVKHSANMVKFKDVETNKL
jgi:chromosome segregation ATPase